MASKKSEVAKTAESAVATYSYEGFEGDGFENQSSDDVTIPFLGMLQSLSPQVKSVEKGGIEGAKVGMLVNTVSDQLFDGDTGVEFVPALTEHCFVEWVPRKQGGGFVGRHELGSAVVDKALAESEKFGSYKVGDNDLVETFYVYGVLCPEGEVPSPIVIGFTSTKISTYKKWNSKLRAFAIATPDGKAQRPPMFAHLTRITTIEESNAHGDFYNFVLAPANGSVRESLLDPNDERFKLAAQTREMVKDGTRTADVASQTNAGGGGTEEPSGKVFDVDSEKPQF